MCRVSPSGATVVRGKVTLSPSCCSQQPTTAHTETVQCAETHVQSHEPSDFCRLTRSAVPWGCRPRRWAKEPPRAALDGQAHVARRHHAAQQVCHQSTAGRRRRRRHAAARLAVNIPQPRCCSRAAVGAGSGRCLGPPAAILLRYRRAVDRAGSGFRQHAGPGIRPAGWAQPAPPVTS